MAIRFAEKQDTEEQRNRKAEAGLDRENRNLHIDELKLQSGPWKWFEGDSMKVKSNVKAGVRIWKPVG